MAPRLPSLFVLTIAISIFAMPANAQKAEVLNRSSFQAGQKSAAFAFIEPSTDTAELNFVATISVTGERRKQDLELLFYKLKAKAQELGANSFRLNNLTRNDSARTTTLTFDTYYGPESALAANAGNGEKNVVYIFGDAEKSDAVYTFKLNNAKAEIRGGTFYKYQNNPGEEVKLNKGGFTGATMWIKGREDRPPTYLTLTGFGLSGPAAGQFGVGFNTGRISYVDAEFGRFLVSVLEQSN